MGAGTSSDKRKSRLHILLERNKEAIVKYMNLTALAPALWQNGLLDVTNPIWKDNSQTARTEFLSQIIKECTSVHEAFSQCVKETSSHLGHKYITSILEDTEFENEDAIPLSKKYQEQITRNMTQMMELYLPSLMPHLTRYELMTQEEAAHLLRNDEVMNSKKLTLFSMLENKGPTAHLLFALCLRDEKEHPRHKELYQLICSARELQVPSPKSKRPNELKVRKPLRGKEYDERRARFEGYYHNAEWGEVEKLAKECLQSEQPEVRAIGHLESALGWIFRVEEDQATHHIGLAIQVCKTIPSDNDNRTFLEGRGEYLLSLLYLYLEVPHKAKEHIQRAKTTLFYTEVGEDKTFACYVDAKVAAYELSSKQDKEQLEQAIRLFNTALDYAEFAENLDILVIYSLLRLCDLYLYTTTHTQRPPLKRDELPEVERKNIHRATGCLDRLRTSYYDSMDLRCQSIFKLAESNLHKCCGRISEAIQSAKDAKRLTHKRSGCYKIEFKQATEALESLSTCT